MPSKSTTRFSVSMPSTLARQLDKLTQEVGLANRSQSLARLVRDGLAAHSASIGNREITGTITLVYDHHKPRLQALLTSIQHDYGREIVATLHVHLDHERCLEVLIVRGKAKQVRKIADRLTSAKGILHGRLAVATADNLLPL